MRFLRALGIGVVVTVVVAGLALAILGGLALVRQESPITGLPFVAPVPTCSVAGSDPYALDPEQAANAAIIAAVAHKLGLPPHAVTIALATALQESKLYNLPFGDRDSIGLFQQRPSQGWGTAKQVADPVYATTAFYSALRDVKGWADLDITVAAQKVQRSGYPDAYAKWEPTARAWARTLGGETAALVSCRDLESTPAGRAAVETAMRRSFGELPVRRPVPTALGRSSASWLVTHAATYGISEVTYAGRTWRATDGQWSAAAAGASAKGAVTYRLATAAGTGSTARPTP